MPESNVAAAGPALTPATFETLWSRHVSARRRANAAGLAVGIGLLVVSIVIGDVDPVAFVDGVPDIVNYVAGTMPRLRAESLGTDIAEWYWGFGRWLVLLGDTIVIAFLGTLLGFLGAFALCFEASSNLARSRWTRIAARRALELARTVPELVYAMIFVYAFGLGPLAGVLAVAVHSTGSLGKLFAEVNENVDRHPIDGVMAAGSNRAEIIRYAVAPQVMPNFVSYTLLRFEINVRGASVLGLVGAGGIGEELYLAVRQFEYTDISAIVLMIVVTVSAIDLICERLRHALIGRETLVAT
jgi:phosphonate transport system permease protein